MTSQPSTFAIRDSVIHLMDDLSEPTSRIEELFLGTGAELSACAELLRRMKMTFAELTAELNQPSLSQASQKLATVGSDVASIAVEMSALLTKLESLVRSLDAVSAPIGGLNRLVRTIALVSINLRVGVASLDFDREDFTAFANEVSELARTMRATVDSLGNSKLAMAKLVNEALSTWLRYMNAQLGPMKDVGAEVASSLAAVTQQRQKSVEASADSGELAKAIVDRIGETVISLQVGDSLRQRLEHVSKAFDSFWSEQFAEDALFALMELERRQLNGANMALSEELQVATSAVKQLSVESQRMLDGAKALHGGNDSENSPLDALRQTVEKAVHILRQGAAERQSLDRVAAEVSTSVNQLLEEVEKVELLEHQMRIVSFNATIRSSRLDESGRALKTVAQQLRDLTKEIGQSAKDTVASLMGVADLSSGVAKSLSFNDSESLAELESEAENALHALEGVSNRIEVALSDLSRDVPVVKHRLHQVVTLLGASEIISSQIGDVEAGLQSLGAKWVDVAAEQDFYVKLRNGYTMSAERMIHDGFVGQSSSALVAHGSETENEESLEDAVDSLLF